MKTTRIPRLGKNAGRPATGLATLLRLEIAAGRLTGGQFLPTERQLAQRHGVARMTVRRALKQLEGDGLIAAEPRQGYRVRLGAANDPGHGCPIAFVLATAHSPELWDDLHKTLLGAFQIAAGRRGCPLLSVSSHGLPQHEVLEQLKASRAWGAVLDTTNPELLALVARNGLPAVMVDAWREDATIDAVVQDDYQGGLLAANYLAGQGHRRIAWLGPVAASAHSLGRFAGVVAGLTRAGLDLPPTLRIEATDSDAPSKARELLSRLDRPSAVLALWSTPSQAVVRAGQELGLVPGRDFETVGWSTEEQYPTKYHPGFPEGLVPPAILWSAATMAEMAVTRLAERRANPLAHAVKINVPVRLYLPGQ